MEGSEALRVLNLEDSLLDAEIVQAHLLEAGIDCELTRVQTRADFAAALEKGGFNLILSDYTLPSFDGLSALEMAQEVRPDVPFILVSGTLGEEVAIESLRNGATDYVLKHRLERLVPAVRRAMRETEERSERRRAEEALRRSEVRFRTLVQNASDIVVILETDGTIRYESPAVYRVLGFKPEERIGTNAFDYLHPDDLELVRSSFAELSGKPDDRLSVEYRVGNREGSWHHFEAIGTNLLHDPTIQGIVINSRDITERKRVEEEIKTRAQQQSIIAKLGQRALASPDLRIVMDEAVDLAARALNADYCNVIELLSEGDELLQRAELRLQDGLISQATIDTEHNSLANYALKCGSPVATEDLRTETRFREPALLRDHEVVSGIGVIIHGPEGPFGVLSVYTKEKRTFTEEDVDFLQAMANVISATVERQRFEEKLIEVKELERRRIAADLHDKVLQDLVFGLQETQMMQVTAHVSNDKESNDDSLKTIFEALQRSIEGLREAIFELRQEENLERSFVSSLEALVELNRRMSRKQIDFRLHVEKDFPESLSTAAGRSLTGIVQEALSNARRHSDAREIRVGLRKDGGDLCVEVIDDGRGFDTSSARGGIGLSSIRQRALNLGGVLEIESKLGAGTVVRFRGPSKHLFEGGSELTRKT